MKAPLTPWERAAKAKRQFTVDELDELWRPHPGFIGPVAPPMCLWLKNAGAQRAWRIKMNLTPEAA